MNTVNPRELSAPALAYLGDSVIEICVRRLLVSHGIAHSADLNSLALNFVRASAQAEAIKLILPILTEDEDGAFRRGRNMGHSSSPKSATVGQYRAATGMEALFGWLYIQGMHDRIDELFSIAYKDQIEKIIKK